MQQNGNILLTPIKDKKDWGAALKQTDQAFNDIFNKTVSSIRQPIESLFNWISSQSKLNGYYFSKYNRSALKVRPKIEMSLKWSDFQCRPKIEMSLKWSDFQCRPNFICLILNDYLPTNLLFYNTNNKYKNGCYRLAYPRQWLSYCCLKF
jgi:hypothetical protein